MAAPDDGSQLTCIPEEAPVNISSLSLNQENPVIEVRMYRKWMLRNLNTMKDEDYCCIVIDRQGNAIQATMDPKKWTYFDNKMEINVIYRISGFYCQVTKDYQRTLSNSLSLRFGMRTLFIPLNGKESEFPQHYFELVPYSLLQNKVPYQDRRTSKKVYPQLTDFMGRLRSIGDLTEYKDKLNCQRQLRKVDIESTSGPIVQMTMWDQLAKEFSKENFGELPFNTILVVTSCRVSTYRGPELNSTDATYFYINPRIQAAVDAFELFKQKYSTTPPLQIERSRRADPEAEKTRNRQTIASLLRQKSTTYEGVSFTCEAELTGINSKQRWSYPSCNQCNRLSVLINNSYMCENHGKQHPVTYRYRFRATATDSTANADFTFFTLAGEKLTGMPCNKLRETFTPTAPDQLPPQMTSQIGQQHIFQIQFLESSQTESIRFVVRDILDIKPVDGSAHTGQTKTLLHHAPDDGSQKLKQIACTPDEETQSEYPGTQPLTPAELTIAFDYAKEKATGKTASATQEHSPRADVKEQGKSLLHYTDDSSQKVNQIAWIPDEATQSDHPGTPPRDIIEASEPRATEDAPTKADQAQQERGRRSAKRPLANEFESAAKKPNN